MTPKPERIFIKYAVNDEQLLYIMLSDRGTINRMGDGSPEEKKHVFMGRTETAVFSDLLDKIPADLMEMAGRYVFPDPKGDICTLTVGLEGENLDTGFEFTYGTESDGPPEEVVDIVEEAVALTEDWYQKQKAARRQKGKKG